MANLKGIAGFIEPMLLLRTESLQAGPDWLIELKLDGYRALAFKTAGKVELRSRNDNDLGSRFPAIVKALSALPNETVVDGELVAFDESGRPSFNELQNYRSSRAPVFYYAFDLLILSGKSIMKEPIEKRRELLESKVLSKLSEPVRDSQPLDGTLEDLVAAVKAQGLEGLVAKRLGSRYEPGERSGAWQKMRVNQGQKFVIGGYTSSPKNFDAIIFGYYDGDKLVYVARTRNGFTPRSREELFKSIKKFETP